MGEEEKYTPLSAEEVDKFNDAVRDFLVNKNEGRLQELFGIFDRNGNGKISPGELKVVMETI